MKRKAATKDDVTPMLGDRRVSPEFGQPLTSDEERAAARASQGDHLGAAARGEAEINDMGARPPGEGEIERAV